MFIKESFLAKKISARRIYRLDGGSFLQKTAETEIATRKAGLYLNFRNKLN
jgi:hypothetical protein